MTHSLQLNQTLTIHNTIKRPDFSIEASVARFQGATSHMNIKVPSRYQMIIVTFIWPTNAFMGRSASLDIANQQPNHQLQALHLSP